AKSRSRALHMRCAPQEHRTNTVQDENLHGFPAPAHAGVPGKPRRLRVASRPTSRDATNGPSGQATLPSPVSNKPGVGPGPSVMERGTGLWRDVPHYRVTDY